MSRFNAAIENALWRTASAASGAQVLLLAGLLYGGIGLALPIVFNWSLVALVVINVASTTWAGLFMLVWLGAQAQAANRRHLFEWTSDLRRLDSQEFEWLVGELFRREGWVVEEHGRPDAPDGNIDLVLTRAGVRRIVQCKRWESKLVGVDEVRGFGGTLMGESLPASAGVFVTLSGFTEYARAYGRETGLELIDNRDLHGRIEDARRPEPCPSCGAPMLLDRSTRGWWFRCLAPGCQGKRDLGPDPRRAVDFLTTAPSIGAVTDAAARISEPWGRRLWRWLRGRQQGADGG